ncbi:MAG: flagellar hook-length control protein FliK [Campylobacterota bacterium]|nr:flagellar hook-length control protein FliK [Campylobacterota bacterium]
MIVVNAQETKEPSGLSQLLLGKKGSQNSQFSKFLEAFDLNEMLETKDFNLETALDKAIVSKEKSGKIIEQDLIVLEPKNSKIVTSKETIIDDIPNKKTLLKETTLSHLLQGEAIETAEIDSIKTVPLEDNESQFLHPKMINMLEPKDIKLVVNSAKTYLKEQIDVIIKEQNIDIKSMPQTLKGLSEMAKKLGVNLEKITLDHIALPKIQEQVKAQKEPIPLLDMKKQEIPVQTASIRSAFIPKESQEIKKQEPLQRALHVKSENHVKAEPLHVKSENHVKAEPLHVKDTQEKITPVKIDISKVITKTIEADLPQTSKPLELNKEQAKLTVNKSLSDLLHTDTKSDGDDTVVIKTVTTQTKVSESSFVNIASSDSLEVKAKEAQQMVRHFATDIKEAVENYKPPFTRLKMTLNPAKLGEVDVTLIQRGNNVHINISSNNTALTVLSQNINDLKTQLTNSGVVNTSMQFSTSHGEHQHQEGRHQQFQTYKDLDQMSEEELEIITSMEIILPRYV